MFLMLLRSLFLLLILSITSTVQGWFILTMYCMRRPFLVRSKRIVRSCMRIMCGRSFGVRMLFIIRLSLLGQRSCCLPQFGLYWSKIMPAKG